MDNLKAEMQRNGLTVRDIMATIGWGSGQQDMSAAQGTKWTLGAATRWAAC